MSDKRIEQAAQAIADEATNQKMTVSDLFYRLLEKSDDVSDKGAEAALRACEILEEKKP